MVESRVGTDGSSLQNHHFCKARHLQSWGEKGLAGDPRTCGTSSHAPRVPSHLVCFICQVWVQHRKRCKAPLLIRIPPLHPLLQCLAHGRKKLGKLGADKGREKWEALKSKSRRRGRREIRTLRKAQTKCQGAQKAAAHGVVKCLGSEVTLS